MSRSRPPRSSGGKSSRQGRAGFHGRRSGPKPEGRRFAPRPSGLPPRQDEAPERPQSDDDGESQRLQKFMAAAGVGSRRHCEEMILAGRVEVDGQTITKLGTRVSPSQKVYVDGTLLKVGRKVYYLVNKPTGVVTTNHDPSGRQRVIDLLPATQERLFAVGRLDRASEGLLLVTNDGELAQRLTHPKYGIQKTYRVQVAGVLDREAAERLVRGIHLAEGVARADAVHIKASQKNSTWLEMVLSEGRNREVRRLLAKVGHKVLSLRRIAVGPLKLRDMAPGEFRQLTPPEVKQLWAEALAARKRRKRARPAGDASERIGAGKPGERPAKGSKPPRDLRGPDADDDETLEDLPGDDEALISPEIDPGAADVLIADDVEIGGEHFSGAPAATILGDEDDVVTDDDDAAGIPFVDSEDEDEDLDFELDGPDSEDDGEGADDDDDEDAGHRPKKGVRGPRVLRPKGTRPGERVGQPPAERTTIQPRKSGGRKPGKRPRGEFAPGGPPGGGFAEGEGGPRPAGPRGKVRRKRGKGSPFGPGPAQGPSGRGAKGPGGKVPGGAGKAPGSKAKGKPGKITGKRKLRTKVRRGKGRK